MNPRKAKDLLAEVAEETSIDLPCLKVLSAFYWARVRQELVSLESSYLMIPHLGTFSVKSQKALLRTIARYERLVKGPRVDPPTTMGRYAIYKNNEEKLAKLYQFLENMAQDDIRWQEKFNLRKDARKIKDSMGQQVQDTGGDNQLSIHQEGSREDICSADENL